MAKTIAVLITTLGIIVAVCAAAKLPDEGRKFPTTTAYSLVALLMGAAGLTLWRVADRRVPLDQASEVNGSENPLLLVDQLQQPLEALCQDAPLP